MDGINDSLLSCCVTTFYNPHTFWIIFDNDTLDRGEFCDKINAPGTKYFSTTEAGDGELVLLEHDGYLVRGQVVQYIKDLGKHKEYLCWQLDYGIFSKTRKIYKLPEKYRSTPPFARKAMLYGLLSLKKGDNFDGVTQVEDMISTIWAPGIIKTANQLIKAPNINHKFRVELTSDDFVIGDLFLQSEEGCRNIQDELISTNLATFIEDFFMEHIEDFKKSQNPLGIIYLQTKFFSKNDAFLSQTQVRCHGRGILRASAKPYDQKGPRKPGGTLSKTLVGVKNVKQHSNDTSISINIPESLVFPPAPSVDRGRGKTIKMLLEKRQNIMENGADLTKNTNISRNDNYINGRGYKKDISTTGSITDGSKTNKRESEIEEYEKFEDVNYKTECETASAQINSEWETENFDGVKSVLRNSRKLSSSENVFDRKKMASVESKNENEVKDEEFTSLGFTKLKTTTNISQNSFKEFTKAVRFDLFKDADETASNLGLKKPLFRDSAAVKIMNCLPAGAAIVSAQSKTDSLKG